MSALLRDIFLSYWPSAVRRTFRPESTARLLHIAILTGLIQTFLFGFLLLLYYERFLVLRARQFEQLGFEHATAQAGAVAFFSIEFLFRPLTLVLLYFAVEGLFRFAGGLCFSEVVPTFPAFAGYKVSILVRDTRHRKERQNSPPDAVEWFDAERLKVAASFPKPTWTRSITIGIQGKWYEGEEEQRGLAPRPYIYLLRPAPPTKILRGYEEYNAPPGPTAFGNK